MAATIERELKESSKLIESQGGVFEVEDRGNLIFSKKALGRFPEEQEIIGIVKAYSKAIASPGEHKLP